MTCAPVQLLNGQVNTQASLLNGRYPYQATISFSCDSGYTRTGSSSAICLDTGTWSHAPQTCNIGSVDTVSYCLFMTLYERGCSCNLGSINTMLYVTKTTVWL